MKQTMHVSPSGLTQCPSCQQHIRLEADIHQTDCPFCNSSLTGTQMANRPTISLGKKGLIAAAIIGVTAAVGCVSAYGLPPSERPAITDAGDESNANDAGAQVEKSPDTNP